MSELDRFSWYEEDFTAFLLSLKVPAYRKGENLSKSLKNEKRQFLSSYKKMLHNKRFRHFSAEFYSALSLATDSIKRNFDILLKTVEYYDNADMAAAQASFDLLMEGLLNDLFICDISFPEYPSCYYRVRESKAKRLRKPADLFHIPYKNRHLVSNERYSLAGHPCLYLSSFLHMAWQECGYPHQFYYSKFQYQRAEEPEQEWKFITFLSPHTVARKWFVAINEPEKQYTDLAVHYLATFPLIFACSLVNNNGNSVFKPEYVVPQMLTQWVFRNNSNIKGIKYFSCFPNEEDVRFNGYNVVIPAKDYDRRGYSRELSSKFRVSKPIYYNNHISNDKAELVKDYKEQLLCAMEGLPREASDCLYELYQVADILDKTIRSADNTDLGLVMSIVTLVKKQSRFLLSKHKKKIIVDRCNTAPDRNLRLCNNLSVFEKMYDEFEPSVIDVADKYDLILKQYPSIDNDIFYTV